MKPFSICIALAISFAAATAHAQNFTISGDIGTLGDRGEFIKIEPGSGGNVYLKATRAGCFYCVGEPTKPEQWKPFNPYRTTGPLGGVLYFYNPIPKAGDSLQIVGTRAGNVYNLSFRLNGSEIGTHVNWPLKIGRAPAVKKSAGINNETITIN